jgi:pimeloyl-ACP methyl ester carboxylesterase
MSIYEQAEDLNLFLRENDIEEKVTLVGHSFGAKVAMAYSLLYPEKVEALCSIDSPPVDRNEFPQMNRATR